MSADEKKRLEYEAREKAIRDYNSQMESAKEEGARRIITNMLQNGIKPETIAEMTGENLEDIQKLQQIRNGEKTVNK